MCCLSPSQSHLNFNSSEEAILEKNVQRICLSAKQNAHPKRHDGDFMVTFLEKLNVEKSKT